MPMIDMKIAFALAQGFTPSARKKVGYTILEKNRVELQLNERRGVFVKNAPAHLAVRHGLKLHVNGGKALYIPKRSLRAFVEIVRGA